MLISVSTISALLGLAVLTKVSSLGALKRQISVDAQCKYSRSGFFFLSFFFK